MEPQKRIHAGGLPHALGRDMDQRTTKYILNDQCRTKLADYTPAFLQAQADDSGRRFFLKSQLARKSRTIQPS